MVINDNMTMKKEMQAMQEQNSALQARLHQVEQVSEEQKSIVTLMVDLWGQLATRSAERSKDPELMKGVQDLLNNYNAGRS